MTVFADTQAWARFHFQGAQLHDKRRTGRLVEFATVVAGHPEKSFTQLFDWNQVRSFYTLCNRPETTLQAVQTPHWHNTRKAMSEHQRVLIVHDTTDLDYSSHRALQGAGPVGKGNKSKGFLQHNSLAVVPKPRQLLGLSYQQWRVRKRAPKKERSPQRKRRQRESEMWLEGIQAAGAPPEGCQWIDVGDRGSDIYEAMIAAQDVSHHFLFRVTQNRTVFTSAELDQQVYLKDYARSLPSLGSDEVDIPGRGGRPARTAKVQLAVAPVWVPAPSETPQRWEQPIVAAWVIRVWEDHPPSDVDEPLEWILLCSVETETLTDCQERRDWYSCRQLVEDYHLVEKSGCREEDRCFQRAAGMEACVALLAVVAVRVLQLRLALEWQPEAPSQQVATKQESQLIRRYVGHRGRRFTVKDFVHGVAKLGGYLGRNRDGPPGVRSLWRGYQRLQDMLLGYHLHSPPT